MDVPVQLNNQLTGADAGGQWTEISAVHSLPGAFNPGKGTFQTGGQPAGTYTFRYFLSASAPCVSQEAIVSVVLDPVPVADAGADKAITCTQSDALLGGPGTSSGPGNIYDWTTSGSSVGSAVQLQVTVPGTYQLLVTNSAGCMDSDAVSVILDNTLPRANLIKIVGVKCKGERNGKITVDSITSAHPPVLISLNGGPFETNSTFSALKPGKYTVTLQDAEGCEWTSDTLNVSEPPQLTVDLGTTIEASLGDSVLLKATISVPLSAIHAVFWNPALDTANAGTLAQHLLPFDTKQIAVRVTDTSGCVANARVLIVVSKIREVYIPNIFHPGSSLNDVLTVYGGKDVAEVESFQVYDRWGNQIFEALHLSPGETAKGWNGKYKGEDAPTGVYVYYAVVRFINGEKIVFKGDVTVLR
jgi:gliding motility-associated-like protein